MYQTLRYEKQENIGILTINRPEALNALNSTVIGDLEQAITEILHLAVGAFVSGDLEAASRVEPLEEIVDGLCDEMKLHHVDRLQKGVCTLNQGFIFNDLLTNYERVADHCSNIAARLVGMEAGEDYDSHTLKNMMHHNPTKEYMLNYEQCRKDYLIPLEQLEA